MVKGFSGMPGNLQGLVKQAQKLQEQMQKAQEEADNFSADGSAGGGMVKVTANGKGEIAAVTIDPQVASPGEIEMLQDLIVAACNEAIRKVQEERKEKLSKITGGMNIPGLF
ncbi:MAG: YbaB/EbfC family nucleoid-associated protein [Proteobacteria bacterium]|nr:MAG: YbaB/EbfC family nucleoid-associated protein [Pseudomonadota bacterium]